MRLHIHQSFRTGPIRHYVMIGVCTVVVLLVSHLPTASATSLRGLATDAKVNLKGVYKAQMTHFAEHDTYADFQTIGFTIQADHPRYVYGLTPGPDGLIGKGDPPRFPSDIDWDAIGIRPGVTTNAFTAVAVGNLDADSGLEIWSLNHKNRLVQHANDMADFNPTREQFIRVNYGAFVLACTVFFLVGYRTVTYNPAKELFGILWVIAMLWYLFGLFLCELFGMGFNPPLRCVLWSQSLF